MKKNIEIVKNESVTCLFEELTKEKQNDILEERRNDYFNTGSNWYYEAYIEPEWDYQIEELKRKYDIDFNIDFECGASYIYIKEYGFKAKEYYKEESGESSYIEYTPEYYKNDIYFNIDNTSYQTEEEAQKIIEKEQKEKYQNLVNDIDKLFNKMQDALLYGIDDDFEENERQNIIDNEEEFTIKYKSEIIFDFTEEEKQ